MSSTERGDVPRTEGTEPEVLDVRWGLKTPAKPVWIRLDAIYIRDPGTPIHVNGAGLDLRGEVPGLLTHWVPECRGGWAARCNFSVPYADQRPPLMLRDQLVPGYALRPRAVAGLAPEHSRDRQ